MANSNRHLLELLRLELKFLEDGGYNRSPLATWRASHIFEDSPTCLNFSDPAKTHPCDECPLMQLVPAELREQKMPCRFIPLNDKGETVDSLYRTATQGEIEEVLGHWLHREISRIESELIQDKSQERPG